mgnify:CR=1 FL=1
MRLKSTEVTSVGRGGGHSYDSITEVSEWFQRSRPHHYLENWHGARPQGC